MQICKCYLHAKLSDELSLQSDGSEESIYGNTWYNLQRAGLLNTSHLCHTVLIILWASLWTLQVIK